MANNNIELRNIMSLSGMNFYIPDYQRGYRWTKNQAVQMLEDFKDFCKKIANKKVESGEFYCLQPIVVKKKTWVEQKDGKNVTVTGYEVIDGQQRLTTLYILSKCLENVFQINYPHFKLYSIKYETRLEYDSQKFLETISEDGQDSNAYIDFFYMKTVYQEMKNWINSNPDYRRKITDVMLDQTIDENTGGDIANNVRVIWYEIADEESATSIDIFTRLNIGKIPLTNAELIKALLLRKSNFISTETTMKQLQIATEWNYMERRLQDDSFWYFIYRTNYPFAYENRIEYIFDIMKKRNKDSELHHTFNEFNKEFESLKSDKVHYKNDQARIEKIWQDVKNVFQSLEEWYEDRNLYHYIGFLIEYGEDINKLIAESATKDKTKFLNEHVKGKIKSSLKGIKIEELSFSERKADIRKVLLLFNILTVLQDKKADMRFPFYKYKKEKWDIEHVCSQTDKEITDDKQRMTWIDDMLDYFVGKNDAMSVETYLTNLKEKEDDSYYTSLCREYDIIDEIINLRDDKIDDEAFKKAYQDVCEFFKENRIEDKDNIANLTLLDQTTNRSYGNAFFPIKRKRIIENDQRGVFVPIATKNLFLKYYSQRSNNLMYWEESDGNSYVQNIKNLLKDYLTE